MAHRLTFTEIGNGVVVHESSSEKAVLWHWQFTSQRTAVITHRNEQRTYIIREWITPTECRATLHHVHTFNTEEYMK